ncbi:MAG: hypothetical protein R2852_03125 [Bacteroidia bacterium]
MEKQILLFLFSCFTSQLFSQSNPADTIYKTNGEVLLVHVLEIKPGEVKYHPIVNPSKIELILSTEEIKQIVFSNGIRQSFKHELIEESNKNNIKVNFLSPLGDRFHVNYERVFMDGVSYELGLNAIGIGKRNGDFTPVGLVANAGVRFYTLPAFNTHSTKVTHVMNGAYIQPSFSYGLTKHSYTKSTLINGGNISSVATTKTNYFMFFVNIGRQFIYLNKFSFDISAGIGYGSYSNQMDANNVNYEAGKDNYTGDNPMRYGFIIYERAVPVSLNAQFKIGYLFH